MLRLSWGSLRRSWSAKSALGRSQIRAQDQPFLLSIKVHVGGGEDRRCKIYVLHDIGNNLTRGELLLIRRHYDCIMHRLLPGTELSHHALLSQVLTMIPNRINDYVFFVSFLRVLFKDRNGFTNECIPTGLKRIVVSDGL